MSIKRLLGPQNIREYPVYFIEAVRFWFEIRAFRVIRFWRKQK